MFLLFLRRLSETLRRPMNTLRRMRRGHYGPAGPPPPSSSSRDPRGSRPPPGAASRRSQNPHRGYQEGRGHYQRPKGLFQYFNIFKIFLTVFNFQITR